MANQVIVTNTGNVQVALTPPPNVQVQISRAAIGTVSNVPSANFANYAGNVTVSNQPNITSLGTLTGLLVSGNANITNLLVTGNLTAPNLSANTANYANYSNFAGNVTVSNQPNITTLGTLTTLTSSGNITAPFFIGNGSQLTGIVTAQSNNANYANYANFAGTAFNVSGSNVTGAVANATFANSSDTSNSATVAASANSVAVANVVGIGNIAVINLDGNLSNILYGNGIFAQVPNVSNVANANYANFAGEAFSVNASNIVGTVNLANFATTANSVAGINVSGQVSNANFAVSAGVANSANSVALANVSGIGNIANVNLDGSSSNVLFGNGVFAPESTSIANANYSNFAGNLINGTSNVNIPSSGGNITFSTNNNANLVVLDTTGVINTYPLSTSVNAMRINSVGNPVGDAHRLTWARSRGTTASPTSVQANDFLSSIVSLGHNGSALQTSSIALVRAVVDNSYTANGANIPIGYRFTVNDTNGGTNNQAKSHNFWSNGNVSFSNSVFVTDSLSATGNVTGNYIIGSGSSLSSLTGGNVTGAVAFATTANSVAVANVSGIGNIATTNFDGNASNVLYGNGNFYALPTVSNVANANYANFAGTAFSVSGSNVSGEVANANYSTYSGTAGTANSVAGANVSGAVGLATFATTANAVAGANVSGAVAFATTANSVAVANVSGIGNIATVNLDGNVSNLLTGSGTFVAIPTVSSNANYANFAGEAFSVNASNIVGTVNLANFATTANAVAGANVSGAVAYATTANSVALANVSGAGNIASINLDGSSSNVLFGNGVFAAGGGGGGTPGGSNTELQFNNAGSFGGISTVTWNGSNISLGAVANVKVTGGVTNEVMRTDGTGNLSFISIAQNLLVGTRAGPYTVPITNYTFQVTTRTSGNVTVYVN